MTKNEYNFTGLQPKKISNLALGFVRYRRTTTKQSLHASWIN